MIQIHRALVCQPCSMLSLSFFVDHLNQSRQLSIQPLISFNHHHCQPQRLDNRCLQPYLLLRLYQAQSNQTPWKYLMQVLILPHQRQHQHQLELMVAKCKIVLAAVPFISNMSMCTTGRWLHQTQIVSL